MLILASGSPRRRELLKNISSHFSVIVSDIDERLVKGKTLELPMKIAKMKAYAVFSMHTNDTIIACDTIVVLDGEVIGKPKDDDDAKAILRKLSGREHLVVTGYTIISPEQEISRSVVSKVTFNELSDDLIEQYVETGSPRDKAGAYGIQDKNFPLVKSIIGSYDNVMGFPTEDITRHLKK
jgi:septum formation protein